MSIVKEDYSPSQSVSARIMSGEWRFLKETPEEKIVGFATTLAITEPDTFLDLHVRRGSNNEFILGFKCWMPGTDDAAHDKMFHKLRDKIAKHFGDALKGWSISNPTKVILQKQI